MEKMDYCHRGLAWILPTASKKVQVKRNTTAYAKPERCEEHMKNLIGIQKCLVPNPITIPHFMWLIRKVSDNWVQYLNESSASTMSRGIYHGLGATTLAATSEREFILVGTDFFRKTLIKSFISAQFTKSPFFYFLSQTARLFWKTEDMPLKYQRRFLKSWNGHY